MISSIKAGRQGGSAPVVLNAANEAAVAAFLAGDIPFLAIPEAIAAAMGEIDFMDNPTVDQILDTEKMTREFTVDYLKDLERK